MTKEFSCATNDGNNEMREGMQYHSSVVPLPLFFLSRSIAWMQF